jgi:hypothetical protein
MAETCSGNSRSCTSSGSQLQHVQFGTMKFPGGIVGKLLERARAHADVKAFITIDEPLVLRVLSCSA